MVKKKRQTSPGERGDESTESCDENAKTGCPHVAKAIDLSRLKRAVKTGGFDKECAECRKAGEAGGGNEPADDDYEVDTTLWMCLRCGSQLCGRARNKHALAHFNTPHSDCHALAANSSTWELFCYGCNGEVRAASTRKLLECVEYLRKQAAAAAARAPTAVIALPAGPPAPAEPGRRVRAAGADRVRGLTNLGNTCFFNSVMQCLVQTPYLLPVLQQMAQAGERFTLPGGALVLERGEVELPPIAGELSEWGPLTRTLAETLAELQTPGASDVLTPHALLSAITGKLPQFGGGDQHDSHELLRHLLEAVRSEDLRRYQSVILKSLGLSSKIDPTKVDGEIKQKVKFYGQQASDTMLRPEQVFRGFMVSTLECQECFHTSERPEYFLDLSLPVATSRPQPPAVVRRKAPSEDDNMYGSTSQADSKQSKHQLKKEQRAARKAARKTKTAKGHSKIDENDQNGQNNKDEKVTSSEQSDADVEDNVEETGAGRGPAAAAATQTGYFTRESGYNSEKVISSDSIRTSPVDLDKEKCDNHPENINKDKDMLPSVIRYHCKTVNSLENLSNPDSGVASPDATKNNSTETVDNVDSLIIGKDLGSQSSLSSELNLDLSVSGNKSSPAKTEYERPVSRISFVPESKNQLISRGISAEGSSNILKLGKAYDRKSYDNLAETSKTTDTLIEISNSLETMNLWNNSTQTDLKTLKTNLKKSMTSSYSDDMALGGADHSKSGIDLEAGMSFDSDNAKKPLKKPIVPYLGPYSANTDSPKTSNLNLETPVSRDYLPSFSYGASSMFPRYQSEEGECSVQSCLSQFTALELMTGNNKVGCEACTERINGKEGKTVYTNATKQFLVSSPPAVLILHLKRFQLGPRCMFRKMAKHVDFPIVLDLAPFCLTKKIRSLPNVAKGQTELLYSLYGVVEHSGGMHGGHYVAYVKVRAPIAAGDSRHGFLPTGANVAQDDAEQSSRDGSRTDGESDSCPSGYESEEAGAAAGAATAQVPPGRWYYVSDSMVSEVTEEKVLRAQAYLLFYERIL